jgi:hypothetical protein
VALGLLPGAGAPQDVSFSVRPLLPSAPIHRWAPLQVELTSTGAAAHVEVRITEETYGRFAPTEYRLPAELSGPGTRRYQAYIRPHPFVAGGRFTARLVRDGRVVQTLPVTLRALDPNDRFVLVVHPEPGILGAMADLPLGPTAGPSTGRVQISYLKPEQTPDRWAGYDAADLVVLGNVTAEALSAPQQAALLEWVRMGGTVVATGGDEIRLRSEFFRQLAPAGLGRVQILPFDISRPPYRGSPGTVAALRQALRDAETTRALARSLETASRRPGDPEFGQSPLGEACLAIPEMDAPPFGTIGLFLAAYLICLVPVNYAFLRRRDRKEWAWVTTPAIVFIFSALAYAVGFGIKGGRVVVSRTGVIEARAGAPTGAARSHVGLFSPRKTRYDLTFSQPRALLYEWRPALFEERGRALTVREEERWSITGAELDMWSMRVFSVEHPVDLGEGIRVLWRREPSDLKRGDGVITNRTPFDIEECHLIAYGSDLALGRLARGASVDLASAVLREEGFSWLRLHSELKGDDAAVRTQRAILEALGRGVPGGAPRLIGWVRQPLFEMTVDGRPARETNVHLISVQL